MALGLGVVVLLYVLGFRIGSNGAFVRAGTIVLQDLPKDTEVYTDQNRAGTVRSGSTRLTLTPGTHSLIVTAPDSQPWSELVLVGEGETTFVEPLLIPLTLKERLLSEERQEEGKQALATQTLPTKAAPLLLQGGCAVVYVSGNRVIAEEGTGEACTAPPYLCSGEAEGCLPTVIFEPGDALRSVIPFPNRNDALILASGNVVYVLELDPREPRFFAPLAKGKDLRIAPWSDTSILLSKDDEARELPL